MYIRVIPATPPHDLLNRNRQEKGRAESAAREGGGQCRALLRVCTPAGDMLRERFAGDKIKGVFAGVWPRVCVERDGEKETRCLCSNCAKAVPTLCEAPRDHASTSMLPSPAMRPISRERGCKLWVAGERPAALISRRARAIGMGEVRRISLDTLTY